MRASVMSRHVSGEIDEELKRKELDEVDTNLRKQEILHNHKAWLGNSLTKSLLAKVKGMREANRDKISNMNLSDLELIKAKEQVYKTVIELVEKA